MKKTYEEVKAELIYFSREDIIITSGEGEGEGEGHGPGGNLDG